MIHDGTTMRAKSNPLERHFDRPSNNLVRGISFCDPIPRHRGFRLGLAARGEFDTAPPMNCMCKTYCVLVLVVVLNLTACGPSHQMRSEGHPSAVPASSAPEAALVSQKIADAKKLVADKNWPEAIKAQQGIIEANSFSRLSGNLQHEVLIAAGEAALYHGSSKLAYEYFVRATSLPKADFDDWYRRLIAAGKVGNTAESVSTLTVLAQRWPDRSIKFRPEYIRHVIDEAKQSGSDSALPLLQALYDAHWKLKWDIEPSAAWRDLILRLVEKGRLAQAIDVSAHVTDVYVLIAMRADRRFDAVIAANAAQFDIDAAAKRERLYTDYDEYYNWILDERSDLLERVRRWDDAVAQFTAASNLFEDHAGNVSQLINLAQLYVDLERPKEALEAIGRVAAKPSSYGTMQLERVRLEAASQLGDSLQIARSMQYLEKHRADAPNAYEKALIVVNQLDRAAILLLERLRDKDQRITVLASVQTYAVPPRTPRQIEFYARWRTVLARQDVRAAIQQVGRVEQYELEER
jgi:beta-barrel assembly-enhancing protease